MKTIIFYRDNGQWYADVPGHTQEENEMVAGADVFLDKMSIKLFDTDIIKISVSDNNETGEFIAKLIRKNHDDAGATYTVTGKLAEETGFSGQDIWLCDVVHSVLGEHPESIYIHSIVAGNYQDDPKLRDYFDNRIGREFNIKAQAEENLRERGISSPDELRRMSGKEVIEAYRTLYWNVFNNELRRLMELE